MGAFASFTLGEPSARGGLGLELGGPAGENLYIGLQSRDGRRFEALPFFQGSEKPEAAFLAAAPQQDAVLLHPFAKNRISRTFRAASDSWQAGDLTFCIYSPIRPIPAPDQPGFKEALLPAVLVEIAVDNRRGKKPRTVFFGYEGKDPSCGMRRIDGPSGLVGIGQGHRTAIASKDRGVAAHLGFHPEEILKGRHPDDTFGLGQTGLLTAQIAPGQRAILRFAVCFYRAGIVTTNRPCRYFYTRFFPDILSVAQHALARFASLKAAALKADARFAHRALNPLQRFMLAHALRSYYGSTQLLEQAGRPFWVVNEGEYRMMNTLDLTVDHLFLECRMNPWTVRNTLDEYLGRYSYRDRLPGPTRTFPGGLSFAHDMGVANSLSPPGHSAYERPGLTGCFSYMTHEQLVNWLCCALVYLRRSGDAAWGRKRARTFQACLESLLHRDHPDPAQRDGIMDLDSDRCAGGSEITTYDSLDPSLGRARRNLYLAVKCWAAYLGLEDYFKRFGPASAARAAAQQAQLCAQTICRQARADGTLPALLDESLQSRIIPAVEGLVFVHELGLKHKASRQAPHAALIQALTTHLRAVLKPGVCLFPDGGWKLSSSSQNSWLSKIYLCQFIARHILGLRGGPFSARADAAHAAWLLDPSNTPFAWSDQMVAGKAQGSRYYPRGITSILWLDETSTRRPS